MESGWRAGEKLIQKDEPETLLCDFPSQGHGESNPLVEAHTKVYDEAGLTSLDGILVSQYLFHASGSQRMQPSFDLVCDAGRVVEVRLDGAIVKASELKMAVKLNAERLQPPAGYPHSVLANPIYASPTPYRLEHEAVGRTVNDDVIVPYPSVPPQTSSQHVSVDDAQGRGPRCLGFRK
jgi:hypothetical protein